MNLSHLFSDLTTERLHLRQLTPYDAPEILIQRSDPRILQYIDITPAQTRQDALDFIAKIETNIANGISAYWAIARKSDPLLIGTICLWDFSPENARMEIGYSLHPDHQGKGYMQEAFVAAVQFGFETLQVDLIKAYVHPENTASVRLLARNNFMPAGESEGLTAFAQTVAQYLSHRR